MKNYKDFYESLYNYFYMGLGGIGILLFGYLILFVIGDNPKISCKETESQILATQFNGVIVNKRQLRYYKAYVIYVQKPKYTVDIRYSIHSEGGDSLYLNTAFPYLIPLHIGDSISKIKDTNLCRIVTKDTAVYTYFYDPFTPCAD